MSPFLALLWVFVVALPALTATSAMAQEGDFDSSDAPQYVNGVYKGDEIDVELIAESQNAVPGQTLWTAIRLDPTEGWHTYSKWPGDSGDATFIHSWRLPEGAQAGDIQWPVPTWLPFPGSDLVTFSYKKEVLLMVPIEVPADFSGDEFSMTAHVEWQVCDLICLIEDAEISLSLPVTQDALRPDPQWADMFAATRATLPTDDHTIEGLFAMAGERVSFSFTSNTQAFADAEEVWFFPEQRRILDPGPLRDVTLLPGVAQITHAQPRRMLTDLEQINGLLAVQNADGQVRGYEITADLASPDGLAAIAAVASEQAGPGNLAGAERSLLTIIVFAILGGLILNLMPCVFPVLSIKVLNLTAKGTASSGQKKMHGLAYTAGIVLTFMALASVLLVLRAGGEAVGWAFQLQSPWFVALLVFLFFVMGLSLSGVYEFGTRLMGVGTSLTTSKGYKSSFFTGVLATVVASPCTAPFMGAALGFALAQSWVVAMIVFAFLGLGMALPFLALAFSPALMKHMPKPGPWMVTFKEFMAFPMYAAALWLLWVLGVQVGVNGMVAVASAALLLALALWLLQKSSNAGDGWRRANTVVSLVMIVVALSVLRMPLLEPRLGNPDSGVDMSGADYEASFEPFASARVTELRESGIPVLVNMTAAWCITCLANEQTTLNTQRVQQAMRDSGITYMKGDWTNQDPEISRVLDEFDRPSVPLYILYPGNSSAEPVILPQLLTPSIVLDAFASL
ncbi:protein-disulfide reductase DsbD family protein [Pseudohongiella sp.]|uniref:protein-disulfide reductase DsbD family protein n=1 Tax=Pseudohongiella sp. TaxID=1979412 RepID=UPI0025E3018D|nr:thioredoxin family protein [Pseudohongiella sp.]